MSKENEPMKWTEKKVVRTYIIGSSIAIAVLLLGVVYQGFVLAQVNRRLEQTDCDANSAGPDTYSGKINGFDCSFTWLSK